MMFSRCMADNNAKLPKLIAKAISFCDSSYPYRISKHETQTEPSPDWLFCTKINDYIDTGNNAVSWTITLFHFTFRDWHKDLI